MIRLRALARLHPWRIGVLVLAAIIAAGAWLPVFSRLVAGPAAHVCHCDARGGHADCACVICFPELGEVEMFGHASASGACGDDEAAVRPFAIPAVVGASPTGVIAPSARIAAPRTAARAHEDWCAPPPTPPPERGVASRT